MELPQRQKGRSTTWRAGIPSEPSKAGPHPPTTRSPHKDTLGAPKPAHKDTLGAPKPAHKDTLGTAPKAPRAAPQKAPKAVPQTDTHSEEVTKPWRPGIVDYVWSLLGYPPGRALIR